MNHTPKPARILLTEDYLDLNIGLGYEEGTILQIVGGGQYAHRFSPVCGGGFSHQANPY